MSKNRLRRKIIIGVLVIVIGLLVALILTAWVFVSIMDKTNGTIVSSGVMRRYLLYVPKTYDRSKPTPLVISLHMALWPAAEMAISRWNDVADEHNFIVVYPSGSDVPRVWHIGGRSMGVDVRFISDLIDKLKAEYNIDPNRIYADGMSIGGGMAFALSCKLSDRVAAVGAVAAVQAFLPVDECGDSRPVPTVAFHGTADRAAPYQGGSSWVAPVLFPNIPDWTTRVARRNQCKGDPSDTRITANVRRLAYTNCAENADVILYTVEGGGHTWPGGKPMPEWFFGRTTSEIDASRVMWEFFVQHPRRPK